MTAFILLQSTTAPVPAQAHLSFWELALKGGWVMIPIALLSIISVYIFIDRYFALRRAARLDKNFMNRIKEYILDDKIEAAVALCHSTDSPTARMILKGLQRLGRPLNDVHTAIENVGNMEIAKLEKGIPLLASVAGAAPMLGFFGTVTGMVRAFYTMASAGSNLNVGLLSAGIYEALVTTVAGLMVGIPAYFFYNYLVVKVDEVLFNLEIHTTEFMDLLNEPVK